MAYANFTAALLKGIGGPNKVIRQSGLSNPSLRNVVKPNVDTVYTLSFIDLSQSDLVLTIPKITDGRYWDYPFYDPFGDQFAVLSSVNGAPAGEYLLRRADDAGVSSGTEITTATTSCIPKYKGIINFPTTYGALLSRILVRENTTQDLDAIAAYQRDTTVTTVPRTLNNPNLPQAPMLTPELLNTSTIIDANQKALELLARLGAYNQPEVPSDRYRIGTILGQAGISQNAYTAPAGVSLDAAQATALNVTQTSVRDPRNLNIQSNGWVLQNLATQGNFKTDYASRYYIALNGYLQLGPSEALYPVWAPAQLLGTSLEARQAYLFTFYGKPPTLPLRSTTGAQGGFWSLTAYAADQFLIPNPLGRYEIGDRSRITYSDGTLVYASANATGMGAGGMANGIGGNATREFQVLLQPSDVRPPTNWTSNWLPAPAGGGELQFLRKWVQGAVGMRLTACSEMVCSI